MKNKYCFEGHDFTQQANSLLKNLRVSQDRIKELELELKGVKFQYADWKKQYSALKMKGNCNECEHKVECTTDGERLTITKE